MKIIKLTTYRVPPRWMLLKIETDEGVVGWGEPVIEGRARTVEAAVHELSEYLVGQDPSRVDDEDIRLDRRRRFGLGRGWRLRRAATRPG